MFSSQSQAGKIDGLGETVSLKSLLRAVLPVLVLPALMLTVVGCSDPEPVAPPVVPKVHRVALILPHGPAAYQIALNDIPRAAAQFSTQMSTARLDLAGELGQSVAQALQQRGYELVRVQLASSAPDQFVSDISSLKGKVDGVLDLAIASAGYASMTGHPYEPRVDLRIRLTNPNDGTVLYEDSVSYARAWNPRLFNIVLAPAPGYDFADDSQILGDPIRAAAGLRSSIPELTRMVVQGVPSPTP